LRKSKHAEKPQGHLSDSNFRPKSAARAPNNPNRRLH